MASGLIAAWLAVAGVLASAIGWPVVYALNVRRDRGLERRDLRIRYLIDSWLTLESVAHRESDHGGYSEKLEQAIANIQLFGSLRQIELARDFARDFASKGNADLDTLLADLRDELRRELGLAHVDDAVLHLRIRTAKAS